MCLAHPCCPYGKSHKPGVDATQPRHLCIPYSHPPTHRRQRGRSRPCLSWLDPDSPVKRGSSRVSITRRDSQRVMEQIEISTKKGTTACGKGRGPPTVANERQQIIFREQIGHRYQTCKLTCYSQVSRRKAIGGRFVPPGETRTGTMGKLTASNYTKIRGR